MSAFACFFFALPRPASLQSLLLIPSYLEVALQLSFCVEIIRTMRPRPCFIPSDIFPSPDHRQRASELHAHNRSSDHAQRVILLINNPLLIVKYGLRLSQRPTGMQYSSIPDRPVSHNCFADFYQEGEMSRGERRSGVTTRGYGLLRIIRERPRSGDRKAEEPMNKAGLRVEW